MRKAHCLCGAVRFEAEINSDAIQACHCEQCQRWTGGGPLFVARAESVVVEGKDNIGVYHASAHGERGFCKTCGTTLFWKMQGGEIAFLPVGLLEDQSGLTVREEVFADRRPGWLPQFEGAEQSTEAEEFSKLAEYLEGQS